MSNSRLIRILANPTIIGVFQSSSSSLYFSAATASVIPIIQQHDSAIVIKMIAEAVLLKK
jgi:hypothetical protein